MNNEIIMTYELNGETKEFHCATTLPLTTKLRAAENIANAVVDEVVGYNPIMRDFFCNVQIIKEITDIELPQDIDECERFLAETDIMEILEEDDDVYDIIVDIKSGARELISHYLNRDAHRSALEETIREVGTFFAKLNELLSSVDTEKLINTVGEFATGIKKLNISEEDVKKFLKTVDEVQQ